MSDFITQFIGLQFVLMLIAWLWYAVSEHWM